MMAFILSGESPEIPAVGNIFVMVQLPQRVDGGFSGFAVAKRANSKIPSDT
jgi:hypothetical protein